MLGRCPTATARLSTRPGLWPLPAPSTSQVSVNDLQSTISELVQSNNAMSTHMAGMEASMSVMQASIDDGLGAAMVNVQAAATSRALASGQ